MNLQQLRGGNPSSLLESCLLRWATSDPAREAFLDSERRLAYEDAAKMVDGLARGLLSEGIERSDHVAVLGHSRIDCFALFLAVASIGGVYVGINPKYTHRELEHVLVDSAPVLLFTMMSIDNPSLSSLLQSHQVRKVIALRSEDATLPGWEALSTWVKRGEAITDSHLRKVQSRVNGADVGAIIYTSGTTGTPKGALIPHRALLHAAYLGSKSMWKIVPRTISDLPINHVGWLVETCLAVAFSGGTLYFRERFDPRETLRIVERERLNSLLLISSMLIKCTQTAEFRNNDLSSLARILFVAPVEERFLKEIQDRVGATFVTGLGMTETAGGYTFTDADADLKTLLTTVGRPDSSVEVRLVDEGGKPVRMGEPGEILVRGQTIFLGYLNRPDATSEVLDTEGFLHTGDVAVMRDDGNLAVVGRRKEMFKSGGYNVYPVEIETVLASHPDVAMAAVVSVKDELWGEVGIAFVTPIRSHIPLSEDDLRLFSKEHLANYKIPKRFLIRSELPVLPNGKIDKRQLREEATRLHSTGGAPTSAKAQSSG